MSKGNARRKGGNISEGMRLATVLSAKPPSFRGDAPNGSCRTLLHHPHRPCVRPESCVRHSLRVKSTDARHPVFFFHFLPPAIRARCVSERMRSFSLSCAPFTMKSQIVLIHDRHSVFIPIFSLTDLIQIVDGIPTFYI